MKIITTVVVVIVALIVFLALTRPNTPINTSSDDDNPTPSANTNIHPYSIESFRTRQFPKQTLTTERSVTANSQVVSYNSEGLKLFALKIVPAGTPPSGGWPVIIVNHGYIPPDQYSVTRSYINTSNYFATQGFLVLKPDYRGHDASEGKTTGRLLSRSEYTLDVLNLLSAINSIPEVNPNKVFMYGHSMGGEITLQILESTNTITAATLWAPAVTDFPLQVTHFLNKTKPSPTDVAEFKTQYNQFLDQYSSSQISSIENLEKISVPVNLHHGTSDESVPYSWGTSLNDKLKEKGKTVNFYSYQGDNHDIAGNFGRALSRDVTFFKSFL